MLNLKVTRDYVEMIFLLNKFLDYNNYKDVNDKNLSNLFLDCSLEEVKTS